MTINLWLIGLGGVLVLGTVTVALLWAGLKGVFSGIIVGMGVGAIITMITRNLAGFYIAIPVGIVLGMGWGLIVRLAAGRG